MPKFRIVKFGLKKLETALFCMVQKVFRYLELFGCESRLWQTNGHILTHSICHTSLRYATKNEWLEWNSLSFLASLRGNCAVVKTYLDLVTVSLVLWTGKNTVENYCVVCDVITKASDSGRRRTKSERTCCNVHWDKCQVKLQCQAGLCRLS